MAATPVIAVHVTVRWWARPMLAVAKALIWSGYWLAARIPEWAVAYRTPKG